MCLHAFFAARALAAADAALNCIGLIGQLAFGTGAHTRLTVGTLTVMEGGALPIGTVSAPVPAGNHACARDRERRPFR